MTTVKKNERCVLTIAVGKTYYYKLAENLLKSFLLWNNNISFLILTDSKTFFKNYERLSGVIIKVIELPETDRSFTSKFSLFDHSFTEENLFIDCDCLVYKNLDFIFDLFKDKNFSAIGNNISGGEFFCNVSSMLNRFNLPAMPKFVGSLYYFKKNTIAEKIFENARELKNNYDGLGFVRLRNKENEEPLFAVAMAIAGQSLQPNNKDIKTDLMYYQRIRSNVLKGRVSADGALKEMTGGEQIPDIATPAILHFNGPYSDSYVYKSEVYRLHNSHLKALETRIYLGFYLPHVVDKALKDIFRPLYRSIWGYRPVRNSNRIK